MGVLRGTRTGPTTPSDFVQLTWRSGEGGIPTPVRGRDNNGSVTHIILSSSTYSMLYSRTGGFWRLGRVQAIPNDNGGMILIIHTLSCLAILMSTSILNPPL